MTDERRNHLKASQRGWIKGRDDCWKAGDKIYDCVFDEYAMHIHEISAEYADAGGISLGPFAYRCEGMGDVVSALFVKGRAALVSLHWGREWHTLRQTVAASGARYEKAGDDMQFWIKGAEARFTRPGAPETTCRTGPAG
jgi:membrane-bound inhibitor of C-type lysozyme